jgi:V-type H+-transporting ATPase proteolipid subunit
MYVQQIGELKRLKGCPLSTTIGIGAAYGTAKSGIGIAGVGTFRSDLIMKVRNV